MFSYFECVISSDGMSVKNKRAILSRYKGQHTSHEGTVLKKVRLKRCPVEIKEIIRLVNLLPIDLWRPGARANLDFGLDIEIHPFVGSTMVVKGCHPDLANAQGRNRNTIQVKRQILKKLPLGLRVEAATRMKGKSANDAYVAVSLFYGSLPAWRHTLIEVIRQLAKWREDLRQFDQIAQRLGISESWPTNPSLSHKPTPHFQMGTSIFISSDSDGRLMPLFEPALRALLGEKLTDLVHLKECQNKNCNRIFWAGRISEEGCLPRCKDITRKQRKRRRDAEKRANERKQEPPAELVTKVLGALARLRRLLHWKSLVLDQTGRAILAEYAGKSIEDTDWVLEFAGLHE